jgi:hypothetical protein
MRLRLHRWFSEDSTRAAWFVLGTTLAFILMEIALVAAASVVLGDRPVALSIVGVTGALFVLCVFVLPVAFTILGIARGWDVKHLPRLADRIASVSLYGMVLSWSLLLAAGAVSWMR